MTKTKSTKRALLLSGLALIMCVSMLIGSTFAWFTDSVTSSGNIIKSGKLEIALEKWSTEVKDWVDASEGKIFNYEKWEPGYTNVVNLRVINEGNLALKWKAVFVSEATELSKLADAIDVYVKPGQEQYPVERTDISDWQNVGSLSDFIATLSASTYGTLEKDDIAYLGIALKMRESAGNEYRDLAIEPFDIKIVATQLTNESDSFSIDYDALADYDGEITNATNLQAAFNQGGNHKITADIVVPAGQLPTVPEGKTVTLDLNGYSITPEDPTTQYALNNLGTLTLWDSKVSSASTYNLRSRASTGVTARGIYNGYVADGDPVASAKLTILSGVYNAVGTNGGATLFNYGVADIKGGTFTTKRYAFTNKATGVLTIYDATTTGGIFNEGKAVVNGGQITNEISGNHGFYAESGSTATINGGNFATLSGNGIIRTYGTGSITINGGTFNQLGKAYIVEGKNVTINGGEFYGYVNGDGSVDNFRGDNTSITINGGTFNFVPNASATLGDGLKTETLDGVTYIIPANYQPTGYSGLYRDGANFYVYTADGFVGMNKMFLDKTAGRDVVINLCADIDMEGKTWKSVDGHYELGTSLHKLLGNGYTIYNLTIEGQAMFSRFVGTTEQVVIKDVTFDNAAVTTNTINTAIIVAHTYENVLLDNVDVVNSAITGGYKVAPLIATVYNESSSTVTATLKNCDVSDTVVKATSYDFCTTGMVSFVYADDNDKIEFENCTVTNVQLYGPKGYYTAHAAIYTTGSETLYNEADGVTVTNVTYAYNN